MGLWKHLTSRHDVAQDTPVGSSSDSSQGLFTVMRWWEGMPETVGRQVPPQPHQEQEAGQQRGSQGAAAPTPAPGDTAGTFPALPSPTQKQADPGYAPPCPWLAGRPGGIKPSSCPPSPRPECISRL